MYISSEGLQYCFTGDFEDVSRIVILPDGEGDSIPRIDMDISAKVVWCEDSSVMRIVGETPVIMATITSAGKKLQLPQFRANWYSKLSSIAGDMYRNMTTSRLGIRLVSTKLIPGQCQWYPDHDNGRRRV